MVQVPSLMVWEMWRWRIAGNHGGGVGDGGENPRESGRVSKGIAGNGNCKVKKKQVK
jgi:hypothetical protein